MRMFSLNVVLAMVLLLALSGVAQAKKYKPINEIPKQVPETDEERGIWNVGLAHQNKVRGTDELVNNPDLEKYLEGIVAHLMGNGVRKVILYGSGQTPSIDAWWRVSSELRKPDKNDHIAPIRANAQPEIVSIIT